MYLSNVHRLYAGERLLADDFYNGTTWEVGLKQFASEDPPRQFTLRILPLRRNAPIYLPQDARASFPPKGEIAQLRKISASPEYEVTIEA